MAPFTSPPPRGAALKRVHEATLPGVAFVRTGTGPAARQPEHTPIRDGRSYSRPEAATKFSVMRRQKAG